MFTKLYLIRHGETEDADARRYKGSMDVPLSENGIKQMERLAKYIYQSTEHRTCLPDRQAQNTELNAVYCSDLSRAVKSAEIIAEPYSLRPVVNPSLRERNFGIWEGMSFDEIKKKYPEEFNAWAGNSLEFSPMQGESTLEVSGRAVRALNEIISRHSFVEDNTQGSLSRSNSLNSSNGFNGLNSLNEVSIAIVSHGGINRIILCHLLGIPLENIFRIEQDFGALNIIEFHKEYPVVKLINYRVW